MFIGNYLALNKTNSMLYILRKEILRKKHDSLAYPKCIVFFMKNLFKGYQKKYISNSIVLFFLSILHYAK